MDDEKVITCPICGKSFAKEDGVNLYTIDEYPVCVVCEDCAYGELA